MKLHLTDFRWVTAFLSVVFCAGAALAVQAPNPRSATTPKNIRSATSARIVPRVATTDSPRVNGIVSQTSHSSAKSVSRSASRQVVASVNRPDVTTARVGTIGVVRDTAPARSATSGVARSAVDVSHVSRAANARATAVFNDVSKIGGGYATCRDAYATCMDQFCANANDTYRRCYCNDRYLQFRDTESALDEAKRLLLQFQDNNLNAIDKTVAEVDAMYSATIGEKAIKDDTSGAQAILNEIGDLLSGKKKAREENPLTKAAQDMYSGVSNMDNLFAEDSGSIFSGNSTVVDLAELEGGKLYKSANLQCRDVVASACENNAVLNMAASAYSILITQDCNIYEKRVNTQRKAVQDTLYQAEKILREARLEEFRKHNSPDINACIAKVRDAITQDTACGANYSRCLDYSGMYINPVTGQPVYSTRLFKLTELIKLDGSADVLKKNEEFNKFLDNKKRFAESALDTCRKDSEFVWNEFKRSALIEIAQAQDEKIEEVRNSCVNTITECYDTQSGAMKAFSDKTAIAAGALSVKAAREMCHDKVVACAALYGNGNCQFNDNGNISNATDCGLSSLIDFVDTVDSIKVQDACVEALQADAKEICTPTSGNGEYPSACFNQSKIKDLVQNRANIVCNTTLLKDIDTALGSPIDAVAKGIELDIGYALADECEAQNGLWFSRDVVDSEEVNLDGLEPEALFYTKLFGGSVPSVFTKNSGDVKQAYGICAENSVRYACMNQDTMTGGHGYAKYDAATNSCVFTSEWYKWQCENVLNGYFENEVCYWNAENVVDGGNE